MFLCHESYMTVFCHSNTMFPWKAVSIIWTLPPAHVFVHCILFLIWIKQINKNNKEVFTNLTKEYRVMAYHSKHGTERLRDSERTRSVRDKLEMHRDKKDLQRLRLMCEELKTAAALDRQERHRSVVQWVHTNGRGLSQGQGQSREMDNNNMI